MVGTAGRGALRSEVKEEPPLASASGGGGHERSRAPRSAVHAVKAVPNTGLPGAQPITKPSFLQR
ncbi:MAG: hypothetical protein ACK559_24180 [bacterium]